MQAVEKPSDLVRLTARGKWVKAVTEWIIQNGPIEKNTAIAEASRLVPWHISKRRKTSATICVRSVIQQLKKGGRLTEYKGMITCRPAAIAGLNNFDIVSRIIIEKGFVTAKLLSEASGSSRNTATRYLQYLTHERHRLSFTGKGAYVLK